MRSFLFVLGVAAVLGFAFFWWQPDVRLSADLQGSESSTSSVASGVVDTKAPSIVESSPADEEIGVDLNEQVTVTFSEPMNRDAVHSAIHANFPYYLHWVSDQEIRLEPASLRPNEQYQYFISTLATDQTGMPLEETLHVRFTTGNESSARNSKPVASKMESRVVPPSLIEEPSDTALIPTSQPPMVDGIIIEELPPLEDLPRYLVTINASDPEGAPLLFAWNVSCGLFAGPQNGRTVEWRTDAEGCRMAVLSVDVSDAVGARTTYVQRAF